MTIIADSGSSKTDWRIVHTEGTISSINTIGFNPVLTSTALIIKELNLAFSVTKTNQAVKLIHYYGAGCWDTDSCSVVLKALAFIFPNAELHVTNDLLGAARSVCGQEQGIACILGTGANSCLYDGQKVIDNIPALGYIMGDEGSGAFLGKQLLQSYFYRELPADLRAKLDQKYSISKKMLLENVYQGDAGNKYLANFTKFLVSEKEHPYIHQLIVTSFDLFIKRQVLKYNTATNIPIHFIGSVAYFLKDILTSVVLANNLQMGKVTRQPIEGLVAFHTLRNTP